MPHSITRRNLLFNSMKLAATALAPQLLDSAVDGRPSAYAPKLSVEGYIFTQYFKSHQQSLASGEEEVLQDAHRAGYQRVELSDPFFNPALREQTCELLRKYKLAPESVYAGTTLHEVPAAESSVRAVLELAHFLAPLGTRVIVTNPSPKPQRARKSDQELQTQVHYINQLATELKAQGIKLLLHHHTPELSDNAREWWYELENTEPNVVGCCVDVHWAYRGGQPVMPFLQRVGPRLGSLHLRNSQKGIWMEDFGPGDVDYAPIAGYLRQVYYRGYLVVELAYENGTAITLPLEEDLRRSRVYAENIFGLS